MKQIKHAAILFALLLVMAGVLPTSAAATYLIDVAVTDCTLTAVVSGGPAGNVYLSITGPELVTPIDDLVTVGVSETYLINAVPGSLISVTAYGDADHTVFLAIARVDAPNGCYDPNVIPSTPDCPYPPSPLLGQLRINGAVTTYWAPRLNAATTNPIVTLDVGTSWWILEARDGFYKVFIACYAQYVWVTPDQVGPNFDVVWRGRALPDAGTLPN